MTILGPANGVAFVRPPHGILRSDPGVLAGRIARALHPDHVAAMAGPLPLRSDLSRGRRKNQGRSSACSAHALTKGAELVTGFLGSDHVLYSCTGRLQGDMADTGRRLVDNLTIVRTIGLAPYQGDSPDGRFSDLWTANDTSARPANVTTPATDAELAAANGRVIDLGQNSLDPKGADLSDLLVGSLAIGAPIYLGTQIGQAFEDLGSGIVAQPDPANDPTGGGHALLIVGHRTNADGSRDFLVCNSWGESWSGNGECWASLAWVAACWELHPLVQSSPSLLSRIAAAL